MPITGTVEQNPVVVTGTVLDPSDSTGTVVSSAVVVSGVTVGLPSVAGFIDLGSAVAGGVFINVQDAAYGATGDGVTDDAAAIQAALDAAKVLGGVWLPTGIYSVSTPLTVPSRVRLWGATAAPNGCKIIAAAGLNNAVIKCGATDGTDPNWHWGEVAFLTVDGNKTNQTIPATSTVSNASIAGQVVTVTTSTAHGYAIGDFVLMSGFTPDGYNGRYPVLGVTSATVFTVTLLFDPAAVSINGTVRRLVNGINVQRAGETSWIHNVVVRNCFDDGIIQGPVGTPMHYSDLELNGNGYAGLNLWTDRPVRIEGPSGDAAVAGLVRVSGKALAGANAVGSVIITGIKSELQVDVPAIVVDDYPQGVTVIGGAITMGASNTTGAPIQRTAASLNSSINVIGTTFTPYWSGAGNIFEDLSAAGLSVNTPNVSATNVTFFVGASGNPIGTMRLTQRLNTLADGVAVGVNAHQGSYHELTCTAGVGANRTIGAPTGSILGQPRAQMLTFRILNSTGGAITTAWNAVFVLAGGAWTDPANGKSRFITFVWNGDFWLEISRSSADT